MKKNLMTSRLMAQIAVLAVLLYAESISADEPKNHDFDVNREEAKVPPYQLPPLLVSSEGRPITTPEEWFDIRRPQIMALFGNLVYGVVPAPELPIKTTIEVVKTDREFMGGKATRKDVGIRFENAKGSAEMLILVFTPNNADRPAPALLLHSFASTKDEGHDASPVYRLLGKTGLDTEASPPVGQAILQSNVGYHNLAGRVNLSHT